MSETLPVTSETPRPAGHKHPSHLHWFACGGLILLVGYIFLMPFTIGYIPRGALNTAYIGAMNPALRLYAHHHDDQLPPTLWALIPECLSPERFDTTRYVGKKKGERLDWLYFPRETLNGLPSETILLAAPATTSEAAGMNRRLVLQAGWEPHRIPEADFQRLIREQNPPPAK